MIHIKIFSTITSIDGSHDTQPKKIISLYYNMSRNPGYKQATRQKGKQTEQQASNR